jgi:hypothetical protein
MWRDRNLVLPVMFHWLSPLEKEKEIKSPAVQACPDLSNAVRDVSRVEAEELWTRAGIATLAKPALAQTRARNISKECGTAGECGSPRKRFGAFQQPLQHLRVCSGHQERVGHSGMPRFDQLVFTDIWRHAFDAEDLVLSFGTDRLNVAKIIPVEVMHVHPFVGVLVLVGPRHGNGEAYLSVILKMLPHRALNAILLRLPDGLRRIVRLRFHRLPAGNFHFLRKCFRHKNMKGKYAAKLPRIQPSRTNTLMSERLG